jgi:hypothetical protein
MVGNRIARSTQNLKKRWLTSNRRSSNGSEIVIRCLIQTSTPQPPVWLISYRLSIWSVCLTTDRKGADDMREALGERFPEDWKALPRVKPDVDEVLMLERLIELQHEQIDLADTATFGRFCKTLARFNGKAAFAMLEEKLKKLLKLKATVLAKGIKAATSQVKFGEETSAEAELVVQRSYTDGTNGWLT